MTPVVLFKNGGQVPVMGDIVVRKTLTEIHLTVGDETAATALKTQLENGDLLIPKIQGDNNGRIILLPEGSSLAGKESSLTPVKGLNYFRLKGIEKI